MGRTVLVAEDDAGIRELLVEELERLGFSALAAPDGLKAEALVHATTGPLVVVLDPMMPGLSGLGLLERLAQRTDSHRFAVLVASATPEGAPAGRHPNVLRVFHKPYDLDEILRAVEGACAALTG